MSELLTIYPAIDILDGKCVRLFKGDYEQKTVFDDSPLAVAQKWKSLGAEFLHIVDLDGAKVGQPINLKVTKTIYEETGLPIQTGGGIRDFDTAKKFLDAGIERIILGTSALKDPEFTKRALGEYGPRVAVGMDCRNGMIATEGWLEDSDTSAISLAKELKSHGLGIVIYTDISKDGTLSGPNLSELEDFAQKTGIMTIASGGIAQDQDVKDLQLIKNKNIPIEGVIIGKALYTGAIDLASLTSN